MLCPKLRTVGLTHCDFPQRLPIAPLLKQPPRGWSFGPLQDQPRTSYNCTWLPSSTTRLVGSLKNSIALSLLLSIQAKTFSRHNAISGALLEAISFCRPRKKLVRIMLNG